MGPEAVPRRQRLGREDIEDGMAEMARIQHRDEVVLDDMGAPAEIHEAGTAGQAREGVVAENAPRLVREG